jgi:hypothetical protein
MKIAKKKSAATIVAFLSSFVLLLFCSSSFFSTPTRISSVTSTVSGPVNVWKSPTVNLLGSLNWAGYAINASINSVVLVKGSWIQPAVTCPTNSLQFAAFWVGIDGLTSPTVEQTGTLAQCYLGQASYYAWYEFYPNSSVNVNSVIIHPGDTIFAEVKYTLVTNKFIVTIQDLTTGQTYTQSATVSGALRTSAEWIVEAPSSPDCNTNSLYICPLADFGTVSFGKGTTGVLATDVAKVSSDSGPIAKFGPAVDGLEMISFSNTTKAIESPIKSSGTSFSVKWSSAGP